MLKIAPDQMAVFEHVARQRFVGRSRQFLQQELDMPVAEDRVRWIFGEGARHGLRSEQGLVQFAIVVLLAEKTRDPQASEWITGVMRGPGTPEARLERLGQTASRRWAAA